MPKIKSIQPRVCAAASLTFIVLLSSCAPQVTPAPIPTQPAIAGLQSQTEIVQTPAPSGVRIGDSIPSALRDQIRQLNVPANESVILDIAPFVDSSAGFNEINIQWVYALAAPFPTIPDGVTFDALHTAWTDGTSRAPSGLTPLLMTDSTLAAFTVQWDAPAPGVVRIVDEDRLLETAWAESAWAIVPFESLEPKWKVLTVDGQSPIRKGFDVSTYPLVIGFTLQSSTPIQVPITNYVDSNLTTIIMTGVTALVRATAVTMEYKSVTYPGEKIRDVLREADITHISNEIPFFTGCTFPTPDQAALVFCSDPKYIDLLTDVGADVIELTGNHFADRGAAGMLETIEIYNTRNLPYFGGGLDLQDSLEPALFDMNGNKIAFIGCNKPDVDRFPTARDVRPGAAPCDFEYLARKIAELNLQGYVVISTFQWNESYDSRPSPQQMDDFRLMADSGASIVSGSQAHYAQMMEFYGESFIHYGLGNLFFDQMGDQDWMPAGIRRIFLDRYVIYGGRLISVELLTGMVEDYSRPRWMTDDERAQFLNEYFFHSGWMPLIPTPTPTVTPTLTPMSIPPLGGTPVP